MCENHACHAIFRHYSIQRFKHHSFSQLTKNKTKKKSTEEKTQWCDDFRFTPNLKPKRMRKNKREREKNVNVLRAHSFDDVCRLAIAVIIYHQSVKLKNKFQTHSKRNRRRNQATDRKKVGVKISMKRGRAGHLLLCCLNMPEMRQQSNKWKYFDPLNWI